MPKNPVKRKALASKSGKASGDALPVATRDFAPDADVSGQIGASAPTFGNLLQSVGNAVASSQALLDKSVVETVNTLSKTNIEIVTDCVLRLDDDGMPITPTDDDLKTSSVSVLNYFWPTVHEWKRVALSMDLAVSAFHQEHGITFEKTQKTSNAGACGLFWGFLGWFGMDDQKSTDYYSNQSSYDQSWTRGQIRMDAQLGPRQTTKLPAPTRVSTGPQMFLTPGSMVETKTGGVVTQRSVELYVKLLKADGDGNPNKVLDLSTTPYLLVSQVTGPPYSSGNATNSKGEAKFVITRLTPGNSAAYPVRATVSAKLGDIEKTLAIVI